LKKLLIRFETIKQFFRLCATMSSDFLQEETLL